MSNARTTLTGIGLTIITLAATSAVSVSGWAKAPVDASANRSSANRTVANRTVANQVAANDVVGKIPVDAQSENAAIELVRVYLPELNPVIGALRSHSSAEYNKAITDLARTARRLASLQDRDVEGFELEVAWVQWQTRADLAFAKLQVRDDPETRKRLKDAIRKREELRLQRILHDRRRLEERRQRIDSQLKRIEEQIAQSDVDAAVEKTYAVLIRKLPRTKDASPRSKRTASPQSPTKQDQ